MASFPNTKKTFSAVVNGVTKLVAALFNTPYDEIEAIETFVGSIGSTQSYSESLKNLLLSYRRNCNVEYKGVADLYVRAGEIAIPDASGNVRLRRNTSDTTVDWDDIDTGSEANATQYYVYAVADTATTTFTVLISTSDSTPTGATYYKRLGSFYNNASGNIELVHNDISIKRNIYDSGWFAVAHNNAYTKTHNLNTTKVLVALFLNTANDGSGNTVILFGQAYDTNDGSWLCGLTTTEIIVRTGTNNCYRGLDSSGNGFYITDAGSMRIIIESLQDA